MTDSRIGFIAHDNAIALCTKEVRAYIEAALAEREAQVRAEEREKVAGLVEALEKVQAQMKESFSSQHAAKLARGICRNTITSALATYNDNRKG